MEGQSSIIKQPTNVTNDHYKSQHLRDPQFINDVRESNNGVTDSDFERRRQTIGLELLIPLDHIYVKQHVIFFEWAKSARQYEILDGNGQRIFVALETTDAGTVAFGGSTRPFTIDINDFAGQKILTMRRRWDCCKGDDLTNSLGDGTLLGEMKHPMEFVECGAKFNIKNANGESIMLLRGKPDGCVHKNTEFFISTTHGEQIGVIRKRYAGFRQEFLTDADNFEVEFSRELDVSSKALILAAVFLLDFLYFE